MASAVPEQHLEVLDELLPEPKPGEGEEIVDLTKDEEPAAPPAAAGAKTPPAATPDEDADLPEQWRGKSKKELAKMLADSQHLIGRQGSELGDLRKRVDFAVQASLAAVQQRRSEATPAAAAAPAAPAKSAVDDVDFFRTPQEAVAKMIAESPAIQEIRKTLGAEAQARAIERANAATARFNQAHPDAAKIMADPEFRTWVESSRIRSALLHQAHTKFDFDAGDELFSTYKALKKTAAPAPAAAAPDVSEAARTLASQKRKQALNDASAPTAGNAAPSQGGAKKIYRRADVLKLMEEQPERYEQLADEIAQAYREGRVR